MSNNFTLLRNFIDIINNRYGLIIGAKYHSFNMNDVHIKSLYNIVGNPTKVVQLTAFFSNSEHLFVCLCVGHWPANLGSIHKNYLKYDVYNEYIKHKYIIIRYYCYTVDWNCWNTVPQVHWVNQTFGWARLAVCGFE